MPKPLSMSHALSHIVLLLCGLTSANAQTLLVRGGTLIDGTGGPPVPNARILIQDGIIKQVGSSDASVPAPAGVQVVDASGKFFSGLIDSHVHYAWYEGELFLAHGVTSVFDLGGGKFKLIHYRNTLHLCGCRLELGTMLCDSPRDRICPC
jgi:adenine deaminase